MSELFLQVLNMSILASWFLLAIFVLRFLFRRAPKWFHMTLWALAAIRLVCPVSVSSPLSLIPRVQTVPPSIMLMPHPTIDSGIPIINQIVNPMLLDAFSAEAVYSAYPLQIWIPVASVLWVVGMAALLAYMAFSYFRLRHKVKNAQHYRDRIYFSEHAGSPFVMGTVRPRIYLTAQIDPKDMEHVLSHERMHIRRLDHWWKLIGFIVLTIHWFNPLVWVSYILLCRDIEMACDEAVAKTLSPSQRADYSQALLNCCAASPRIRICPLAFGEIGIKQRVRAVLNYKKPSTWILCLVVIAITVASLCFATNPGGTVPVSPIGVDIKNPRVVYTTYVGRLPDGQYLNMNSNILPVDDEAKSAIISLIFDHKYKIIDEPSMSAHDASAPTLMIRFQYGQSYEDWYIYKSGIQRIVTPLTSNLEGETLWYKLDPSFYEQILEWYNTMAVPTAEEILDRLS